MSYIVHKTETAFDIIEKDNNLVIKTMTDEPEARKLCRSLNLGAGFNGFTPSFFCYSYPKVPN
jgi:hypothetical protein